MKVGVLALQGAYRAHQLILEQLGAKTILVRDQRDLHQSERLIIPGGESTTMRHLLYKHDLWQSLQEYAKTHSIFGTCAGAILMARQIDQGAESSLNLVDIVIHRNAYGRQLQSEDKPVQFAFPEKYDVSMPFIRAPKIVSLGQGVTVLGYSEDKPVLIQQGRHLCATFHPELSDCVKVHAFFLAH